MNELLDEYRVIDQAIGAPAAGKPQADLSQVALALDLEQGKKSSSIILILI